MGGEPVKFQALNDLIRAAGGRRFLLTVGSGLVNTGLLIGAYIDMSTFKELILATVAVYIASNTYQKVKEMRSA